MATYATGAELAAFLGQVDSPTDADRLLLRASQRIDYHTLGRAAGRFERAEPFDVAALRDAVCAQVEFWITETGEGHDIAESKGRVSIGGASYDVAGPLAPRARNFLLLRGLLNRGVSMR